MRQRLLVKPSLTGRVWTLYRSKGHKIGALITDGPEGRWQLQIKLKGQPNRLFRLDRNPRAAFADVLDDATNRSWQWLRPSASG